MGKLSVDSPNYIANGVDNLYVQFGEILQNENIIICTKEYIKVTYQAVILLHISTCW